MFGIEDESYLAKRAVEEFDSVTSWEKVDERSFRLTRDDGATLTYEFTDERSSDAFLILVSRTDVIPDGVAGVPRKDSYAQVMSALEIEFKVYTELIATWAGKQPLK